MKKLLFIEDDIITGTVYEYHFTSAGYEVEWVKDGAKGLAAIAEFEPDVIVLDLMIPRVNGIEFIRRVRSKPETIFLPVIAFTNEYAGTMISQAKQAGADECLAKTKTTTEELLGAIARTLKAHAPPPPPPAAAPVPTPAPAPLPPAAQIPEIPAARIAPEPEPFEERTPGTSYAHGAPEPTPAPLPGGERTPVACNKTPLLGGVGVDRFMGSGLSGSAPAKAPPLDPRAEFLKSTPASLMELRELAKGLVRADRDTLRPPIVFDLYRAVHALTAKAALAKAPLFAQMASALEALLSELDEKPTKVDASTVRTVNQAVECLKAVFDLASYRARDEAPDFKILAVDDDVVSRNAISRSLDRASLKAVILAEPFAAYELLKKLPFDLIITDINMPGMDGFELCQKLRALPAHARTPVIFVTSLNGFDTRLHSAQSGGDDFIAKPFLQLELAVKALTHIVRGQLKDARPSFQAFNPKS